MRTGKSFYIQSQEQYDQRVGRVADHHGNAFCGIGFYDAVDGALHGPNRTPDRVCAPAVHSDAPAHISPVSGRVINSMSDMRDEFKRTNTRPFDADEKQPLGYTDRNFALSRGLKICDKTSAWLERKAKDTALAAAGKAKAPKRHRTDPNKLSANARNEIVAAFESNGITD